MQITSPSNFINKFLIGCYLPLFLEVLIYELYLFLKPRFTPDFLLFIITLPLILPLIFFYFMSPYLIFKITKSGESYSEALNVSIEEIFISEKDVLTTNEIDIIKIKLKDLLIPELKRKFRSNYVNNYFTQSNLYETEDYTVLNFYETIFLFSFFSFFYAIFNAFVTFYLYFDSIIIEGIVIADKIENPFRVFAFASLMIGLGVSALFLFWIVNRRVKYFIPLVNPGWVTYSDERLEMQILQTRAIADFNYNDVLSDEITQNRAFMTNLQTELLIERVKKIVVQASREQAGKQLTWSIYNQILTELGIEEKKRERLEESFLSSPLIKSAQHYAFDAKEFSNIRDDFFQFNSTLESWDKISDSEKLSAFLLLYRSSESLFRGILRNRGLETGNFGSMILTLSELELISNEEQLVLNQVRRQRNIILHRSGEKISISKKFASEFQSTLENILVRADNGQ